MTRKMPKQKPGNSEQAVGTPPELILAAQKYLNIDKFDWDLAAMRDVNNIVVGCYTKDDDALSIPIETWVFNGWGWLNPEFGDIAPWVQRAYEASLIGGKTCVLIPASMGANWWRDWVEDKAVVLPLNGRPVFVGSPDGYPKDCALLLYTPNWGSGYRNALRWMDLLTDEEKDMAKKRVAAAKAAKPAKAKKKEPRSKIRPFKAPKPTKADKPKKKEDPPRLARAGRVTTFAPNSQSSMQPAPEPKGIDLGPIMLPDPDDALKVLAELAQMNDRAIQAKATYEDLKERAKNAKDKYDDLADQVLTRLQVTTHKSDLPLFNEVEREADQKRMETAASAAPATPFPADDPVVVPAAPATEEGTAAAEDPLLTATAADDPTIPF